MGYFDSEMEEMLEVYPVSYTHLDVYKRQFGDSWKGSADDTGYEKPYGRNQDLYARA